MASFLKFWSITVFLHGMSDVINVVSEHLIKQVIHQHICGIIAILTVPLQGTGEINLILQLGKLRDGIERIDEKRIFGGT